MQAASIPGISGRFTGNARIAKNSQTLDMNVNEPHHASFPTDLPKLPKISERPALRNSGVSGKSAGIAENCRKHRILTISVNLPKLPKRLKAQNSDHFGKSTRIAENAEKQDSNYLGKSAGIAENAESTGFW